MVRTLNAYKERTKALRKSNQLFISVTKPHAEISTQTVSCWLRNALTGAAIDVGFTGHSTQGAATSAAAEAGLSLDIIMAAGHYPLHLNNFTTNLLHKVYLQQQY